MAAIMATADIPRRTGHGMESEAAALRWADAQEAADGRAATWRATVAQRGRAALARSGGRAVLACKDEAIRLVGTGLGRPAVGGVVRSVNGRVTIVKMRPERSQA